MLDYGNIWYFTGCGNAYSDGTNPNSYFPLVCNMIIEMVIIMLDSQLVEVVAVLVHQRHRIYRQIELKLTEHRLRTVDNPDYFHNLKRLGS